MGTVLDELLPMNVSGIRPGYGSFFTVDFSPRTETQRSLWVYLCGWVISDRQATTIHSDCPKEQIDEYLSRHWKPSELISTKINSKAEISFLFDNSQLRLFPYPNTYGEDADIFRFFDKNKVYYLRLEDGRIKEEPMNALGSRR